MPRSEERANCWVWGETELFPLPPCKNNMSRHCMTMQWMKPCIIPKPQRYSGWITITRYMFAALIRSYRKWSHQNLSRKTYFKKLLRSTCIFASGYICFLLPYSIYFLDSFYFLRRRVKERRKEMEDKIEYEDAIDRLWQWSVFGFPLSFVLLFLFFPLLSVLKKKTVKRYNTCTCTLIFWSLLLIFWVVLSQTSHSRLSLWMASTLHINHIFAEQTHSELQNQKNWIRTAN